MQEDYKKDNNAGGRDRDNPYIVLHLERKRCDERDGVKGWGRGVEEPEEVRSRIERGRKLEVYILTCI